MFCNISETPCNTFATFALLRFFSSLSVAISIFGIKIVVKSTWNVVLIFYVLIVKHLATNCNIFSSLLIFKPKSSNYCFQTLNFSTIQLLQIKTLLILIVSGTNWFEVRLSTNLNPFEFWLQCQKWGTKFPPYSAFYKYVPMYRFKKK